MSCWASTGRSRTAWTSAPSGAVKRRAASRPRPRRSRRRALRGPFPVAAGPWHAVPAGSTIRNCVPGAPGGGGRLDTRDRAAENTRVPRGAQPGGPSCRASPQITLTVPLVAGRHVLFGGQETVMANVPDMPIIPLFALSHSSRHFRCSGGLRRGTCAADLKKFFAIADKESGDLYVDCRLVPRFLPGFPFSRPRRPGHTPRMTSTDAGGRRDGAQ